MNVKNIRGYEVTFNGEHPAAIKGKGFFAPIETTIKGKIRLAAPKAKNDTVHNDLSAAIDYLESLR